MPSTVTNPARAARPDRGRRPAAYLLVGLASLWLVVGLPAREVPVTILHTADAHGHVAADRPEGGGLIRCAAVIRDIRARESNVLLLDIGDLFQGTPESHLSQGRLVADCVRAMGYDALITGNHEFDAGLEFLRRFYERAGIPVLAADLSGPDGEPVLPGQQSFLIRELDGVRVAVVGLSNPLIPLWSRPCLLGGVQVADSLVALRKIMPTVRAAKPHILILAVHQGWQMRGDNPANRVAALAAAFPDFDLILGAHSHQAIGWKTISGVAYSQAGCWGRYLGEARLVYDTEQGKVTSKRLLLNELPAEAPLDEELASLAEAELAATRRQLDERIGTAAIDLKTSSRWPGQSAMQNLVAQAIAEGVGAQVVFHRKLTTNALKAGPIYRSDLWRVIPYENFIGIACLTTNELAEILEENAAFYGTREFRGVSGLAYTIDPKAAAGSRVSGLSPVKPIPSDGRLRVAFNSHDLASAGGRFLRLRAIVEQPESRLEELPETETRALLEDYIQRNSPLALAAEPGAQPVRRSQK